MWSPGLGKYLMWVKEGRNRESNLKPTGGFYYAVADTPAGPWGELTQAVGDHLAHDFDLVTAPDGTGWIATDTFSGSYDPDIPSLPLWDVWIQKLNPDMTGTTGQKVRVMSKVHFEGIGFAEHDEAATRAVLAQARWDGSSAPPGLWLGGARTRSVGISRSSWAGTGR
ncbi:hypothetical protein [Actinomadura madurae]|uniref:hypothetical protein n=1 Tax=Actinomadura madurae TaxID=1993 RepID=UPI0020D20DB4|nr:hypothetical protein [Actinomadura madurae]MCP9979209.1 hypothetical protein [Actinomadura madurae]MCQ0015399.1 hypothetical protein [Actinomadura madurae]